MNIQKEIKYKIIARTVIATINRKKYTITSPVAEERKKVKELIERYNTRPTKTQLEKILKVFTARSEALKTTKKAESKKIKHDIKQLEQANKVEFKEKKKLVKILNLKGDKRFVVVDNLVYLKPFLEVPLPATLTDKIKKCIDNNISIEPYINFWMLALLNPNPIARTKLFDYLSHHNLIVTPNGYFVTYRMVKKTSNLNIFTSARTGKEEYVMGQSFSLPRASCDEDGSRECSRGLHTGSPKFIGIELGEGYGVKTVTNKTASPDSYGTGYDNPSQKSEFDTSFGNQAVICLVNPMHVVSIPTSNTRKMRSCEIYFVKTTTAEEVLDLNEKDYLIYDHQYKTLEREQLKELLKDTKLVNWVDKKTLTNTQSEKLKLLKEKLRLSGDTFNTTLNIKDLNTIIKSRIKK